MQILNSLELSKSFWKFRKLFETLEKFLKLQKLFETCFSISYTRKLAEIYCRNIFRQYISASFLVYEQHYVDHTPENLPKVFFRKVFESSSVFKICRQLSESFLVYALESKNFPKVLCKFWTRRTFELSKSFWKFRKVSESYENFSKLEPSTIADDITQHFKNVNIICIKLSASFLVYAPE